MIHVLLIQWNFSTLCIKY